MSRSSSGGSSQEDRFTLRSDVDRVQGAPNDESRYNYLRLGTGHSVARMAGSWSRERPANGKDNARIDDCRVRGHGWVVVGSTRVRTDRPLVRIDTPIEAACFRAGGIMPYVLEQLLAHQPETARTM